MLQGGPRETRLEWLWQRLGGADKKGQAWEGTLRWADPARNLVPGCSAASNQPHWGAGFTSVEWGQSSAQVGVCRGSTIWVPPLAPHAPQALAFQLPARPSGWGEGREEVPSQRAKPGGLSPLPGPHAPACGLWRLPAFRREAVRCGQGHTDGAGTTLLSFTFPQLGSASWLQTWCRPPFPLETFPYSSELNPKHATSRKPSQIVPRGMSPLAPCGTWSFSGWWPSQQAVSVLGPNVPAAFSPVPHTSRCWAVLGEQSSEGHSPPPGVRREHLPCSRWPGQSPRTPRLLCKSHSPAQGWCAEGRVWSGPRLTRYISADPTVRAMETPRDCPLVLQSSGLSRSEPPSAGEPASQQFLCACKPAADPFPPASSLTLREGPFSQHPIELELGKQCFPR